jgi:phage baseplate assembly protein gpV
MTIKMSVTVRNARLDAIETGIGTSAVLKIRSGAPPTNIADADSGTVLATLSLPSDWMDPAASGSKAKAGTWQDASADAAGTAGHFRVYASNGTTQHIQGTVTITGSGGDMTLDNDNIAVGQTVTITGFTLTDGNA